MEVLDVEAVFGFHVHHDGVAIDHPLDGLYRQALNALANPFPNFALLPTKGSAKQQDHGVNQGDDRGNDLSDNGDQGNSKHNDEHDHSGNRIRQHDVEGQARKGHATHDPLGNEGAKGHYGSDDQPDEASFRRGLRDRVEQLGPLLIQVECALERLEGSHKAHDRQTHNDDF